MEEKRHEEIVKYFHLVDGETKTDPRASWNAERRPEFFPTC